MKFRNITDDVLFVRNVDELGFVVEPGDTTPELDKKQAAAFVLQTGTWAAVGSDAKAVQKKEADKQSASTEVKE